MVTPFPSYACTSVLLCLSQRFLLEEGSERLFCFTGARGNSSFPGGELAAASGAVGCGIRAPSPVRAGAGLVIAQNSSGKKCGVDGWTASRAPGCSEAQYEPNMFLFFLPLIFVQYVGFFSSNDVTGVLFLVYL